VTQTIRLGSWQDSRRLETTTVLDLKEDGTLLGVEVLQASNVFGESTPRTGNDVVGIRVDRVADALYVRFGEGPSARQEVCDAVFYVDRSNVLVGIELERQPKGQGDL